MTSTIKVDTISENTSANGVAVDGLTIKDGGIVGATTITVADNTDTLTLKSTDADANAGANLAIKRESGSPADNDLIGTISYYFLDDGGSTTFGASLEGKILDVTNGTEDSQLDIYTNIAGTKRNRQSFNATETVFNEGGIDLDFRVESSAGTHELFVEGSSGAVGIGEAGGSPLGNLHVKSGDSGVGSANTARQELVLEGSGNAGMSILTGTSSVGGIGFGDSGNNLMGLMQYNHATNNFEFNTNSSANPLILNDTGDLSTNGEVAPDTTAGGLCLNQGTADGRHITLKSTGDIAHGMTDIDEADTYGTFSKQSATLGGLRLVGYSEDDPGTVIVSRSATETSTKATNSHGGVHIEASLKSSATVSDHGSNANLFIIANHATTRFIFDAEGDLHADGALNATAYDTYEDAHLVRAMDLSHGQNLKGLVNSKFDEYINYNHETLAEAGLVGREDDGTPNHFINVTGMQRLHNGAIWQQYEKTERLANAMYELAKVTVGEDKANEILKQNEIKLLN